MPLQAPRAAVFILTVLPVVAQVKLPPIKPKVDVLKPSAAVRETLKSREPFIAQYAFCNAMQLYQNRRTIWEPVYREAGASDKEVEDYSANLVNFVKEFCGNGSQTNWQSALDKVNAFDSLTDSRTAKALSIPLQDATTYRIWRLLSNVEAFQQECLGGEESAQAQDMATVGGSLLPSTLAPPGVSLEPKSLSTTLGKCGSTSKAGSPRGHKTDQRSLSACISSALAQTASCDDPAGEAPSGDVVRREPLIESGSGCNTTGGTQVCSSAERVVFRNGGFVDIHRTKVDWNDANGRHHTVTTERETTYGTDRAVISSGFRVTHNDSDVEVSFGSNRDAAWVRADTDGRALPLTVPDGYRAVTTSFISSDPGHLISSDRTTYVPRGTPGRTPRGGRSRECLSVNPGSSAPLGLSHIAADAAGGSSPVHAGRLDTFDLIGQCVCTSLGRLGPQLAASSGLHCGPDENTRRMDCLQNPSGPADGIRPECVRYLQEDNPGRDTHTTITEWCSQVRQCPTGSAVAEIKAAGGANCSCGSSAVSFGGSRGGGGAVAGGDCSRVRCASGPGATGMDLFKQCCAGPETGPIGQPGPGPGRPPVPPRPDQRK